MTQRKTTKNKTVTINNNQTLIIDNTILTLKITWDKAKQAYDSSLKKAAQKIKIKGFRQGKIPLKLVESKIGQPALIEKTLELILPSAYQQLIIKEKKQPLTQPQITPKSIEWEKDWEFEVQIAEKPLIKLGNYQASIRKGLKKATELETKHGKNQKKQDHAKEIKLQHIFKYLVEDIKPLIPQLLLKEETSFAIEKLINELKQIGLNLDHYLQRTKQTFEQMSSQLAAQTLAKLQLEYVLAAIEKTEKITATNQDRKKELAKITDEKIKKQIQNNPNYQALLTAQIIRQKLLDYLLNF